MYIHVSITHVQASILESESNLRIGRLILPVVGLWRYIVWGSIVKGVHELTIGVCVCAGVCSIAIVLTTR